MSNSSDFMDKKCDFAPVCTMALYMIVMTTGPLSQLFSALAKFDYVRAKSVVTKMESLGKVGKGFNFVKNARL